MFDEVGTRIAERGQEFGAVTGRPRRCGWFDAVLLRRSIELNSVSGLCITKLDVLDGLDVLRIAVAYKDSKGNILTRPPQAADDFAGLEPVYEEMPGWQENTADMTSMEQLPANARAYLNRIEELLGIPIAMLSTGPERDSTIIIHNPFS